MVKWFVIVSFERPSRGGYRREVKTKMFNSEEEAREYFEVAKALHSGDTYLKNLVLYLARVEEEARINEVS